LMKARSHHRKPFPKILVGNSLPVNIGSSKEGGSWIILNSVSVVLVISVEFR
jgi:hypothetical protein